MTRQALRIFLFLAPFVFFQAFADAPSEAQNNNQAISKLISSSIAPTPVKRISPKYPIAMARAGSEGWVQVSFVVAKDGSVIDPVVEDSSGTKGFEKAAIRAIKQWQYTPAIVDGEAIEQCQNKVQMDFKLDKPKKSVRRKFRTAYIKAKDALDADDLPTATEYLSKLRDDKQFNGMESAWFWMLEADYARKRQDKKAELSNIKRAINTDKKGELLGSDNYISMLQQRFVLEVHFAKYSDALESFELISSQDNSDEVVKYLQPYAKQIVALLESDESIFVEAKISEDGSWWHTLSRSKFAFSHVQGQVDTVELRCQNKRETYTFSDDSTWHIPEKWGRCSVWVVGDKNVDFNLVELSPQA
jgi:TonB family protein